MIFHKFCILVSILLFGTTLHAEVQEEKLTEVTFPKIENEQLAKISLSAETINNENCYTSLFFSELKSKGSNSKVVYYEISKPISLDRKIPLCTKPNKDEYIPVKFISAIASKIPYNSGKTYMFLVPKGMVIKYSVIK